MKTNPPTVIHERAECGRYPCGVREEHGVTRGPPPSGHGDGCRDPGCVNCFGPPPNCPDCAATLARWHDAQRAAREFYAGLKTDHEPVLARSMARARKCA